MLASRAGAASRTTKTRTYTSLKATSSFLRHQPNGSQVSSFRRTQYRPFSSHTSYRIAIASEKEHVPESNDSPKPEPAKIADAEYHEVADQYLNTLQLALEEASESDAKKGLEIEFSVSRNTSHICG